MLYQGEVVWQCDCHRHAKRNKVLSEIHYYYCGNFAIFLVECGMSAWIVWRWTLVCMIWRIKYHFLTWRSGNGKTIAKYSPPSVNGTPGHCQIFSNVVIHEQNIEFQTKDMFSDKSPRIYTGLSANRSSMAWRMNYVYMSISASVGCTTSRPDLLNVSSLLIGAVKNVTGYPNKFSGIKCADFLDTLKLNMTDRIVVFGGQCKAGYVRLSVKKSSV